MMATQTIANGTSGRRAFYSLEIERIIDETADARSLVFRVPSSVRAAFAYQAGQFLTLEVKCAGVLLRRSYSLASSPDSESEYKVTVKRVAGGRVSNWINDHVHEGDALSVLPPEGRFVLSKRASPIVLFAGGSGITPVISIIKSALRTTTRSIRLVYANRDESQIIFRNEIDALARANPGRLRVDHRLDVVHGLVTAGDVKAVRSDAADADYYLCGPAPFMETVDRGLRDAGANPEHIHIERFASLADPKEASEPTGAPSNVPEHIQIELRGTKHAVRYEAGKTILRTALDAGLDAPYSCEEGFCGCCAAQLVEGQVKMDADDALTLEEKKRGLILTCQSRPTTSRCAIEYLDT